MVDLTKILRTKTKLIFGAEETVKALLNGKLANVLLAKTVSAKDEARILDLGKLHGVEIVSLKQTAEELGALCKVPFNISVIGVKN